MIMNNILIINGPNLNLLGTREPEIYGRRSLDEIIESVREEFPDIEIRHIQSNYEGELIEAIHSTRTDIDCLGIVLNAAACTHTSLALADAISAVPTPVVEVHLSNTAARSETIRHTSLIAPVCIGTIAGFGSLSYHLAVRALLARG